MNKMKKIALMAASVMMSTLCASAQTVNTVINPTDTAEVVKFFTANPSDTIRKEMVVVLDEDGLIDGHQVNAGDTLTLIKSVYVVNGNTLMWHDHFVKVVRREVKDHSMALAIDTVVTETRFHSGLTRSPRLRYDVLYAQSSAHENTDGKPVLKQGRKDGLYVVARGDYQFAEATNGFGFKAGAGYMGSHFKAEVLAGMTRKEFNSNATTAGEKYNSFVTEGLLGWQPIKFDRLDQFRLWVEAGVRFEHYSTNSREDIETGEITSSGNSIAPVGGLAFDYRFFASRWSLTGGAHAFMLPDVFRGNTKHGDWGAEVFIGLKYNLSEGFWRAKK